MIHTDTLAPTWRDRCAAKTREIMGRVAEATNGSFLVRSVAIGGAAIAVGVATFGVLQALENRDRLTRIEAQIEIGRQIEEGFERLERAIRESR